MTGRARAVALAAAAVLAAGCGSPNPYYDARKPHHRPGGFAHNYGPAGG